MKREVYIRTEKEDREYIVTELVRRAGYEDLVDHRVFESWQDCQWTLLALTRASKFALEHGLACPADTKRAVGKIESLPRY